MTATELYELVKGDPEVWGDGDGLDFHDTKGWVQLSFHVPDEAHEPVWLPAYMAERELESLYARATGCGVEEFGGDFMAYDLNEGHGRFYGGQPTRLHALVAAYRANKENTQ